MENTMPTLSVLTCSYCIKKENKYDGSKTKETHIKL